MSTIRKAIVVSEDDSAMTLLKPFSGQYQNHLFVIHEDAYGEARMTIEQIDDLRIMSMVSDEEFNEILKDLEI
jgi:type IV secretory pathway VirD2 relaxase